MSTPLLKSEYHPNRRETWLTTEGTARYYYGAHGQGRLQPRSETARCYYATPRQSHQG